MRILVTNSVPQNGGDEALLRAVVLWLRRRRPEAEFSVLCRDPGSGRALLPDLDLDADLEYADPGAPGPARALAARLSERALRIPALAGAGRRLRRAATAGGAAAALARYREADLVLSSPGGFFQDHYPVEPRLRGLELAADLGKPVVLLPQSFGPFWKPETLRRIPEVFNRARRILTRDEPSRELLLSLGVSPAIVRPAADAAFLWRTLAPDAFRSRSGPIRKVALCFRHWPYGEAPGRDEVVRRAAAFCRHLLSDPVRELLFLSTCQGVPGYGDDSELSVRIADALPPALRARCAVERGRLGPRELMAAYGACDAFAGMRLHGAILAMLGGTPAMALGYERKSAEIFGQLGYGAYQEDHRADEESWRRCWDRLERDADAVAASLAFRLDVLCRRVEEALALPEVAG